VATAHACEQRHYDSQTNGQMSVTPQGANLTECLQTDSNLLGCLSACSRVIVCRAPPLSMRDRAPPCRAQHPEFLASVFPEAIQQKNGAPFVQDVLTFLQPW
jgi:hypothetical protein